MRFLKLFVAVLAVAMLGLVACGGNPSGPSPEFVISGISGGQTLRIGSNAVINWECVDCSGVRASAVEVFVVDSGTLMAKKIGFGPLTGGMIWEVGKVDPRYGYGIGSGYYEIHIQSYPTLPTSDPLTSTVEVFARSGVFQVI